MYGLTHLFYVNCATLLLSHEVSGVNLITRNAAIISHSRLLLWLVSITPFDARAPWSLQKTKQVKSH